jgi:hypothetical protein
MQIKELAEDTGFKAPHGIMGVDVKDLAIHCGN